MSDMILSDLDEDEHVLWSGKPSPSSYAWHRGKWFFLAGIALAVAVIAFANVPYAGAYAADISILKTIGLSASIALIAVPAAWGLFAANTRYALTTKHAVRLTNFWGPRFDSTPLAEIGLIDLKIGWFGVGSVFYKIKLKDSHGAGRDPARHAPDGFIAIDDPRDVDRIFREELRRVYPVNP